MSGCGSGDDAINEESNSVVQTRWICPASSTTKVRSLCMYLQNSLQELRGINSPAAIGLPLSNNHDAFHKIFLALANYCMEVVFR